MQNKNPPQGTIGPAEEILSTYGDRSLGCTGLVIGKHGNLSSALLRFRDFITKSLANQHSNHYSIAPHHAKGMFRRWGLTVAEARARFVIDRIQILVLGFDDETELGAQARQRQFYYSRSVRNGYGDGIAPSFQQRYGRNQR
jgi:hypothetical protein